MHDATLRRALEHHQQGATFYPGIAYSERVQPSRFWPGYTHTSSESIACMATPGYLYNQSILATAALLEVFERDVMHLADVDTLIAVTANSTVF